MHDNKMQKISLPLYTLYLSQQKHFNTLQRLFLVISTQLVHKETVKKLKKSPSRKLRLWQIRSKNQLQSTAESYNLEFAGRL